VASPSAFPVVALQPLGASGAETIPLLDERSHVVSNIGLELEDTFLRKDMGNDLALARVCNAVSGVEQASGDGDKGIIKVGL
jgi:hypothetical protein